MFSLNTVWCGVPVLAALCVAPPAAHGGWSVGETNPGVTGCILETEEISLFDGYQDTRLRLSLGDGALRVKTDSNIDLSFNDIGLAVDGKDFIAADAVVDEKDVLFSAGTGTVIDQFIRGRAVTVYLRFWPTYPATERYQARFSLTGFTRAYNEYLECRSKQSS